MTVTTSTPFSPSTFHKALSIYSAGAALKTRDAAAFINSTLAPIIREHGMEFQSGVGLVHRHFDLESEEILVEFNDITLPWTCEPGLTTTDAGFNSLIYPIAWMLQETDGQQNWMPYEFAFSPTAGKDSWVVNLDNSPAKQAFLAAFTAALTKGGFQDLLGLRARPGPGFQGTLEFTEGRANINLKSGQYEIAEGQTMVYTDMMWFYDPEFTKNRCRCLCGYNSKGFHTLVHSHLGSKGDTLAAVN